MVLRNLFISGGNSGLGFDIARHFARSGYRVFAGTRNVENCTDVEKVASDENLAIEPIEIDVDDDDSVAEASKRVLNEVERLDVLVNNAGIGVFGVAEEVKFEEIRRVMETNFFGAIRLTKSFLPNMRESRDGNITFMSSWMGRVTLAGMLTYACSKSALETFAETLAQEVLRFGISVYILEPGYAKTPMHGKAPKYELPEESPYDDLYRNWRSHWKVGYRNPTLPEDVSKILYEAIEENDPRLRLVIGTDSQQWIESRKKTTDEIWRDAGRERGHEDFIRWADKIFGKGLFRL